MKKYNIETRNISKAMKTKHENDLDFHNSVIPYKNNKKEYKFKVGYIYFFQIKGEYIDDNANLVKIGVSINAPRRKLQLQTKLPFKIKIINQIKVKRPYKLEKKIHKKWSHKKVKGEWFKLKEEDINYIKNIENLKEVI